jgi:hypothetical protein
VTQAPLPTSHLRVNAHHPLGSAYLDGDGDVYVTWSSGRGSYYSKAGGNDPVRGEPSWTVATPRDLVAYGLSDAACDRIGDFCRGPRRDWAPERLRTAQRFAEPGCRLRALALRIARTAAPRWCAVHDLPDLRPGDLLLLEPESGGSIYNPSPLYVGADGCARFLWSPYDAAAVAADPAAGSCWRLRVSHLGRVPVREVAPRIRGCTRDSFRKEAWPDLLARLVAGRPAAPPP